MRKSLFVLTAVFACYAVTPAFADSTASCQSVTNEQISALFERWNASLLTKDPGEVVKNYAPDAVLLATVSNTPRTNHEEIRDYFAHFVEKSPKGVINSRTIHIGCNNAFDVGTYTFTLTGADGKSSEVAARYSFIYELRDGKWLIAHHHSSAMPETAPASH